MQILQALQAMYKPSEFQTGVPLCNTAGIMPCTIIAEHCAQASNVPPFTRMLTRRVLTQTGV
jgi:hypothetical protein